MKTFVLDTSVLLYDPSSIFKFGKNAVQVPLVVIEELDRFKRDPNENGRNARMFSRYVDKLRKQGSIAEGVKLENGGLFRISIKSMVANREQNMTHVDLSLNDNIILACALEVKNQGQEVVLISKDINLRVKADALGVRGEMIMVAKEFVSMSSIRVLVPIPWRIPDSRVLKMIASLR